MDVKELGADAGTSAPFRPCLCDGPDSAAFGGGIKTAPAGDAELSRACAEFWDAHAELDRLLASDPEPSERRLFLLNQRWHNGCLKAASCAAITSEGRQAKAAMLFAVMDVLLGPDVGGRDLHELLAASLAQDC